MIDWRSSNDLDALRNACLDRSGFTREAAVERLASYWLPEVVPVLLESASDWVPQVAVLARTALWKRLTPEWAEAFVECLDIAESVVTRNRFPVTLYEAILRLLQRIESTEAVRKGLAFPDVARRRICFRIALSHPGFRIDELIPVVLSDAAPSIRLMSLRHATQDAAVLHRALSDPAVQVRRAAFETLGPQPQLLLDRATGLRRDCQRAMQDPASIYRQLLSKESGRRLAVALLGLGETGGPQDVEQVAAYLDAPSLKLRSASIAALRSLNAIAPYAPKIIAALEVPSARLTREAARSLLTERILTVEEVLERAVCRIAIFELAGRAPKWPQLRIYLQAVSDPNLRQQSIWGLQRWLRRYVNSPRALGAAEKEKLLALLCGVAGQLESALSRELGFAIETA